MSCVFSIRSSSRASQREESARIFAAIIRCYQKRDETKRKKGRKKNGSALSRTKMSFLHGSCPRCYPVSRSPVGRAEGKAEAHYVRLRPLPFRSRRTLKKVYGRKLTPCAQLAGADATRRYIGRAKLFRVHEPTSANYVIKIISRRVARVHHLPSRSSLPPSRRAILDRMEISHYHYPFQGSVRRILKKTV